MNTKPLLTIILVVPLSSCTNNIRTSEDSDIVCLYFFKHIIDKTLITEFEHNCIHSGEVIGSEGHWYTCLFISNSNRTQGAINDLRNRAHDMGANTVIVHDNIRFATSTTLPGLADNCTGQAT